MASQSHLSTPDGGGHDHGRITRRRPPTAKQKRAREQFGKVWPQLVKDEARKLRDEGR